MPIDKKDFIVLEPGESLTIWGNESKKVLSRKFDKPGRYEVYAVYNFLWPEASKKTPPLNKWSGSAVSGVICVSVTGDKDHSGDAIHKSQP